MGCSHFAHATGHGLFQLSMGCAKVGNGAASYKKILLEEHDSVLNGCYSCALFCPSWFPPQPYVYWLAVADKAFLYGWRPAGRMS